MSLTAKHPNKYLNISKPSYLCVIEQTDAGYSAFLPDVPGVVAAAKEVDQVVQLIKDALYLHLEGEEEIPESTTKKFEDPEVESFIELTIEPADPELVSLRIEEIIDESGIKRTDLAKIMDIPKSSISRFTSPVYRGHSISTLRRIAEALGYEVEVNFKKVN